MRRSGPRRRRGIAVIAALCVLACLSGCGSTGPRDAGVLTTAAGSPDGQAHGPFAGFNWDGNVTSVQGSWRVPAILAGSQPGVESVWIGAQAPGGPDGSEPFIQVGTTDARDSRSSYLAFWSDQQLGFHPHALFVVHAGDRIDASLSLGGGRWDVSLVDRTTGARKAFSTEQDTHGFFDRAEWDEEDPSTDRAGARPARFPAVSEVRFSALRVDGHAPARGRLIQLWMSLPQGQLGPGPLAGDAFTIGPAHLTPAARRYLTLAGPEDAATAAFATAAAQWRANTPYARIRAAATTYAAALTRSLHALRTASWPTPARTLIARLIQAETSFRDRVGSPPRGATGLDRWREEVIADDALVGHEALAVRNRLGAPYPTRSD